MRNRSIRGFTLLEVLVAVLIFSLGLMGLAGLLAVSVKTNHAAYMRTQATFLAQGMADRMRANVLGLWNNSYNLTHHGAADVSAVRVRDDLLDRELQLR